MALLAFCWLIIELKIIPKGFLKWFYLSFYIHPLFLFFCQIFLWLNELEKWGLLLILLPFKITLFITLLISKFLKRVAIILFSFAIKKSKILEFFADHVSDQQDGGDVSLHEFESGAATGNASDRSSTLLVLNRPRLKWDSYPKRRANLAQPELQSSKSSWLNEFLLSDYYTKYLSSYYSDNAGNLSSHGQKDSLSDIDILHPSMNQGFSLILQDFDPPSFLDDEMLSMSYGGDDFRRPTPYVASDLSQTNVLVAEYSPSPCSSDSPIIGLEQEQQLSSKVLEKDAYSCSFHQKYTERMTWFEVLYHDRLCGMRHLIQHMMIPPSARISKQKILRSLESDLELIYVAKLCLIWEALHYQYRKVESLAALSGDTLIFHADISDKFQNFRIILERFMEGENCHEDKKYLDFIRDRICFKGMLQIPDVTGCVKKEENRSMVREVMLKANEVLKIIEKCIGVFWLYVEKDHKNEKKYVRRTFKVISWRTRPPVEDPRDLHLLYDLTGALRKKLLLLNGMQSKKKCWFRRRVKPVQEESDYKNMDLVFGTIDLELVRKVTTMPTISRTHLTWCQHKLSNIEFKQGTIFRTPTSFLFPSS